MEKEEEEGREPWSGKDREGEGSGGGGIDKSEVEEEERVEVERVQRVRGRRRSCILYSVWSIIEYSEKWVPAVGA